VSYESSDPKRQPEPKAQRVEHKHPRRTLLDLRLSIIIVNWNTKELLSACLKSLHGDSAGSSMEVIVVDNGSADGSPEMVAREFPEVKLVRLEHNRGFSAGNNVGLKYASGEYLLLLNSDTEVRGDALTIMCNLMDADASIGALGAQLLNPDGSIQASCRAFPSYRTALFHRKSLLTKLFPRNRYSSQYLMTDSDRAQSMEVDWVIGACLMTRRQVLEEVGPLDEGFFMYAEDVDWCYRMRQAGWKVVYEPSAKVMHHYEKSARKAPYRMTVERHMSMWRFYRKHYSKGIALLDVATMVGIGLRCTLMILRNTLDFPSGRRQQ